MNALLINLFYYLYRRKKRESSKIVNERKTAGRSSRFPRNFYIIDPLPYGPGYYFFNENEKFNALLFNKTKIEMRLRARGFEYLPQAEVILEIFS